MSKTPVVRFRVDFSARCAVGIGKIELLEAIMRVGSLSHAARQLHMSYRRAWLLLQDLNQSFDQPVASANVGGKGGGGVCVTTFGQGLISGYRQTESAMRKLVDRHLADAARAARPSRLPTVATPSIRRPLPVPPARVKRRS